MLLTEIISFINLYKKTFSQLVGTCKEVARLIQRKFQRNGNLSNYMNGVSNDV